MVIQARRQICQMSSQIELVPVKHKISQQLLDFSLGRTLVASAKIKINTGAAVTMEKFISRKILSIGYKDHSAVSFR